MLQADETCPYFTGARKGPDLSSRRNNVNNKNSPRQCEAHRPKPCKKLRAPSLVAHKAPYPYPWQICGSEALPLNAQGLGVMLRGTLKTTRLSYLVKGGSMFSP